MIQIPAKTVYIDPEISARPNCKRRLDRVLPHVKCDDVRVLGPGDRQRVSDIGKRRHGKDDFGDDAVLVFTTFDEWHLSWFYHCRDEAGRHGGQCQPAMELNVVVRARLSPIVPVVNWREEYRELFEERFSRVKPDLVTLELLGWMTVDDLLAMFSPSFIDAEALRQARAAREDLADVHWGPFTQRTHEDIYSFCIDTVRRLSPQTPVSVCHGTAATWKTLGSMMQMTPDNYICNCGPLSTPGGSLYEDWNRENAQPSHRGDG